MKAYFVALLAASAGVVAAQNLYTEGTTYTSTGDANQEAIAARTDALGNVYLLTSRQNDEENRVTKYSAAGSLLWSTLIPNGDGYDYAYVYDMALDASGDPVVVGDAHGKLLLAKFDAASGSVNTFRKASPFNSNRWMIGNVVRIDPSDDTIVVGGVIDRGSGPPSSLRPLVAKFSNDGATQLWISAPTTVSGKITRMVIDKGRVYFGGTTYQDESVYVGYIPTTGGTAYGVATTPPGDYRRRLGDIAVAEDRLVWTATDYEPGGGGFRRQWGQLDCSAEGGGGVSVFTDEVDSHKSFSGLAYDDDTHELAFQVTNWDKPPTVEFKSVDPATDGFTDLATYEMDGAPYGIASLGKGYFATVHLAGSYYHEFYWISVVKRSAGWISGTPYRGAKSSSGTTWPWVNGNQMIIARSTRTGASTARFRFAPGPTNDVIKMDEDTTYKGNVVRNDIGIGEKTVGGFTPPTHAASFSLSASGNLTYRPQPNWYGTDTFTYDELLDGAFYRTRTVTITVKNVNDGPTAVDDAVGTIASGGTVVVDALANDLNPDGSLHPLKYLSVTQPSNATVSLADNKFTLKIKAKPGAAGQSFSFTYSVQNGTGKTSTATVTGVFAL